MKTKREFSAGGIVFRYIKTKNKNVNTVNREWLVCKHSQNKTWGFPKGLVGDKAKNELSETAALREVKEEGGIDAKIIPGITAETKYSYLWKGIIVRKKVKYYAMEYVSGNPENHDYEMSEAKFIPEDKVISFLDHKEDKKAFKKICEQLRLRSLRDRMRASGA